MLQLIAYGGRSQSLPARNAFIFQSNRVQIASDSCQIASLTVDFVYKDHTIVTAAIEFVINFPTSAPSVQVDFGGKNGTVDTQKLVGTLIPR